jgi:DHA3 family macrolide efflux protein-like MFS transporter
MRFRHGSRLGCCAADDHLVMTAVLPKQSSPLITPVRAVWVGTALQSISDEIFRLAVVWMAIALVGTAASALPAIQYFCAFFIGMTAGAIADRFAPRTTMVGVTWVRACFILLPFVVGLIAPANFSVLVIAAVGVAGMSAFFNPAMHASVPRLVESPGQMQAVNGMLDVTFRLARLIGPFLGGVLALVLKVEQFLLVAAGGMFLAGVALSCVGPKLATPFERPVSESTDTLLTRLGRGFVMVRRDKVIARLLIGNVACIGVWALAISVGLAMMIEARPPHGFETRPLVALSIVLGVYGVGDIVSNLMVSRSRPRDRWAYMHSGYIIMGLGIVCLPLPLLLEFGALELATMAILAAFTGLGGPRFFLLMLTEFQMRLNGTDLTALLRLRVALQAAAMASGGALGLVLFSSIGPAYTMMVCGLGIFAIAVIGWWARPDEMKV